MKSQKAQKVVNVIARYFMKRNGHVVYAVRSSNGVDTYCTTIINGKATGCTCPATKPCYHMIQLEAKEAARKDLVAAESELVAEAKKTAYLNCYDDMAAAKVASIEAVREQTREEHEQEDRAYRMAQIEQAMASRKVDGLGYRHEWYPRTSL